MKKIIVQCWNEYISWLRPQWKKAWEILKDAIITLITAIYTWFCSITGTVFRGFYSLFLKPIFKYIYTKVVEISQNIYDFIIKWIGRI